MKIYQQILSILFLSTICCTMLKATHIIGGEVSHEYIGNHNYIVELKIYRDCSGIAITNIFSVIDVRRIDNNSDDFQVTLPLISTTNITDVCPTEPTLCTGNTNAIYGIEEYLFKDTINVPFDISSGGVLFEWSTCCYPSYVSTVSTNNGTAIFAYSIAYYNSNIYNNHSPKFEDKPINYSCVGQQLNYSNGVIDIEKDSIVFSLTDCPNTQAYNTSGLYFYPVQYYSGYSGNQPITAQNLITVNPTTGMISFTPIIAETGPMCVMVEEYRNGVKISEKVRSVLLNILPCSNANPSISGFNGTASASGVTGTTTMMNLDIGQQVCFDVQAYDNVDQNITLNHSDNLTGANYAVSNLGNNPTLNICWTPTVADVGIHIFSVIAEDDNCPTLGKSIQTYKISVNAPFSVQGHILQPDGTLLTDAEVLLYDTTGTLIGLENTTNGFYRFVMGVNNSPNQSYYIAAIPDASFTDLDKTYHGDVATPQYATAIPIYTNRQNIANIMAIEAVTTSGVGEISGIVKTASTGNIAPNARIILRDHNGNYLKDEIADQNGAVQFTDLASSPHFVLVDAFGIDNDIAPEVSIFETPIHDNIEFLIHDTYLELSYPTNTEMVELSKQIQINPNPTSGLLDLKFPITTQQVQVLDINGQLLQQKIVDNKMNTTLDLSDLPNQVYLIQIITSEGVVTKRIVKR